MRIGVCGPKSYGTWKCRGAPLVREFGWKYLPIDKEINEHFDLIILVKRSLDRPRYPGNIRQKAGILICDPLDWWVSPQKEPPHVLWKRYYDELKPDHIIATSSACALVMQESMPDASIWIIPHPCDPAIQPDWYDSDGPIVYVGGRVFFDGLQEDFKSAAKQLGKQFQVHWSSHDPTGLRGASLEICVRNDRHSTLFNSFCKPQIKLENAAAAGMPVLCGGTPAELSTHPEACAVWRNKGELIEKLDRALKSTRLGNPYTQQQYLTDVKSMVDEVLGESPNDNHGKSVESPC